ncbi:MAG: biotin--[acetyl-CoA-carboxylase] ligase [Candidatus Omnitrophica bacterium]|nr:biotin--[acetyl-CoA-carboxylase] ligase [Candidatus Omnitrophota bacterium]
MKDSEIKRKILKFFYEKAEGYVSGEDISEALGFSRANSWKYINKIRNDGYEIEAVPHLGYKLKSQPDKLYAYEISRGVNTDIIGKKSIFYYDSVSSTNDTAYELAEKGEPEGTIVIAEGQTCGKGRMGRKWLSPKGKGIYLSIILRPDMEIDRIPSITLVMALSVQRTIKKMCDINAGIKWPNDILINGRKVCGILTEMKAQPDVADFLIVGIGMNINAEKKQIPPEAVSLKMEIGREINRTSFLRCLLEEIEKDYKKIKREGFPSLRDECRKLSTVIDKQIKVREHNKLTEGIAVDIDEKGALVIRTKTGDVKRIFSGDVSIR